MQVCKNGLNEGGKKEFFLSFLHEVRILGARIVFKRIGESQGSFPRTFLFEGI